jgi:putative oxygen-independent coproporphyrinogen III oxidase
MSATARPGLYIHVPFCGSKCHYCGFFSEPNSPWVMQWVQAAAREARRYRRDWRLFDTVYLGGGTPSLLPDDELAELLDRLWRYFRVTGDSEVTLEVNPADVTADRAVRWRRLGVNRISVGVQSFRSEELRWLGRRHDVRQARDAIEAIRAGGFDNVSLDLIHGLPGQSLAHRLQSIRQAVDLGPEHLSCYELTVDRGTPLAAEVAAGECTLPGSDEQATALFAAVELLERCGYVHYEVSNFARSHGLVSHHNGKYWNHTPYLGIGPGAHSFDGRRRWRNVRSVSAYCARIEAGETVVEDVETLSDEQLRWEQVALGLRTSRGVARSALDGTKAADAQLDRLYHEGFLRSVHDRVVPTERGLMVADALARTLLLGSPSALR